MDNKSSKTWVWVFVGLLIITGIGGAAYALMKDDGANNETQQTAEEMGMTDEEHANMDKTTDTETAATSETTIRFTDEGFDKSEYTSKAGEAVTVKNESSVDVEFSSDDHPTHRENPELNMETLAPGESGTFTPPGAGTYAFHDHINDQYTGTLVVK